MPAPFDIESTRRRLAESGGGYETVHSSEGLELSVYVLVAPEADRQQPHEGDEVYVVLDGSGTLEVGGESVSLSEGKAVFVAAGTDHRFKDYEQLSVLVILERQH
jgi:mannose-6-phosphate isomerase-like protein (cupin superfamily)